MDSLHAIRDENIQKLQEMLEEDLPQSTHAYYYFKTALEWQKKKSEYNILFLAPYDDFTDATFLLYSKPLGIFCGTAYSKSDEGLERLERSLRETKLIDWDGKFLFTCLEPRVARVVLSVVKDKAPNAIRSNDKAYYMTPQEAVKLEPELSEDVYLDDLKAVHCKQINDAWRHKTEGSESLVTDMVELNWGLGLFDRESSELLSWGICAFYGGLGLVQTAEGHTRKGHASNLVKAFTARMGREGHTVHLNVVEGNDYANAFFTKLGFQPLFDTFWIYNDL